MSNYSTLPGFHFRFAGISTLTFSMYVPEFSDILLLFGVSLLLLGIYGRYFFKVDSRTLR
jgi:hypothetical protein